MKRRHRIYLSGRFSQQAEFRQYAAELRSMGHTVVSSWLEQAAAEPTTRAARRRIAHRDMRDCAQATLAILDFSLPPRGGRETEHGAFLMLGTPCWVVKNQNEGNVFSSLGRAFADWPQALAALRRK